MLILAKIIISAFHSSKYMESLSGIDTCLFGKKVQQAVDLFVLCFQEGEEALGDVSV